MKLAAAAVAAFHLAGAASAQGYKTGNGTDRPMFQVSNFNAGATPHSAIGYIQFSFGYGKTAAAAPAECRASPSTYQVFPSVAQTVCSGQGASFNLTKTPDGGAVLGLSLAGAPHGHACLGVYEIPPEHIVWINQQSPTGMVQVYGGPGNFTVEAA